MASKTNRKRNSTNGSLKPIKKAATRDSSPTHAIANLQLEQNILQNNMIPKKKKNDVVMRDVMPPNQPAPPRPLRAVSASKPLSPIQERPLEEKAVEEATSANGKASGDENATISAIPLGTAENPFDLIETVEEDQKWIPLILPTYWACDGTLDHQSINTFITGPLVHNDFAVTKNGWSYYRNLDATKFINPAVYRGCAMLGDPAAGRIPLDQLSTPRYNKWGSIALFRIAPTVKASYLTNFVSQDIPRSALAPPFFFALGDMLGSHHLNAIFTSTVNKMVPMGTSRQRLRQLGKLYSGRFSMLSSSPLMVLGTAPILTRFSVQVWDSNLTKNARCHFLNDHLLQISCASEEAQLSICVEGWPDTNNKNILICGTIAILCARGSQPAFGTKTDRTEVIW